ncbi:MAG: hypothetical protein BJ554DRAFT_174 [Olpidium bornovanus]|uniref:dUTP diphosphatase n=1 Tax=Olpidium bornovanus TaxID=278681 RepID=A0A8H8DIE9_9FUNG|nr:MAG: hypothetical protein BJ554DRAFT_174 [Olpidium bornovanus]
MPSIRSRCLPLDPKASRSLSTLPFDPGTSRSASEPSLDPNALARLRYPRSSSMYRPLLLTVGLQSSGPRTFPPEFPPGSTIAPPDAVHGVNQVGKTTGNVTSVNALRLGTRSRELALGKLEYQQGRRPVGQEARGDVVPLIPAEVKSRPESRPEEKSELRLQSRPQTSDVFAPVIAFQYRKPEWQKGKLVIQCDDVVDVQAIWTVTLQPGKAASIPVPLNVRIPNEQYQLVVIPGHHRVEVVEPFAPGDEAIRLRNKMKKRTVTFNAGSILFMAALERVQGAATYASALNIDKWQRWATEDTTVHMRRVQTWAQWPERATEGASSLDLHMCESGSIPPGERRKINTGLSLAIPGGYAGKIMGQSGLALQSIDVHPGLIDSDYWGELAIIAMKSSRKEFFFKAGDRLAQLVVQAIPKITLQAADDTGVVDADTARGSNGFGSTGIAARQVGHACTHPAVTQQDKNDWKLNPQWCQTCEKLWDPHTIDLFSDPNNGHVPRRYTHTRSDVEATGYNAFAHRWSNENAWANPPFDEPTFWKIIDKALLEQVTMTVVAPVWKSASWYKHLLWLSCDYPRLLPHSKDLFLPGTTNDIGVGVPPWAETMVVRISGDGAKRAEFIKRLTQTAHVPTTRAATFYPNQRKLPFYYVDNEVPVKFDARTPPGRTAVQVSSTHIKVAASSTEPVATDGTDEFDEEGFEILELRQRPKKKAYAPLTIDGQMHTGLLDTASQGDCVDFTYWKKHLRKYPIRGPVTKIQGLNGTITEPIGHAHVRITIGEL